MTLEELKAKYPRLLGRVWFEHRSGWAGLLDAYFAVIDHLLPHDAAYEIRQIKEKWGTLRIYDSVTGASSDAMGAIEAARELAEARSYYACEWCGQPAVLRNRQGYFTTTCDEHALYEGRMAVPLDPPAEVYIGTDAGKRWRRYDPDLDLFVEAEKPKWD
ncbi:MULTISPECIES: hypothetical protein [Rhizobium]|uniref:hypothetical protein n=1 Tax=Rhizobium TaxID=379 RepID=UPI000408127A|nr:MULTISPECIES: hypothetical protein [Rhizobium]UFS81519.1 hypothetical protein LPB79_24930 [Rhizobium sp. T136]